MKTIYVAGSDKKEIAIAEITSMGKRFQVPLTNKPQVIDTVVCAMDTIAPDTLLTLHTTHGSWTTDPEWKKEHPQSGSGNHPAGYVCRYCHEPVDAYIAENEDTGKVRHVRFLCGCTMMLMLMSGETLLWWSEFNCSEVWNDAIVPGG
jgi:hypothetical protein